MPTQTLINWIGDQMLVSGSYPINVCTVVQGYSLITQLSQNNTIATISTYSDMSCDGNLISKYSVTIDACNMVGIFYYNYTLTSKQIVYYTYYYQNANCSNYASTSTFLDGLCNVSLFKEFLDISK